MRAKQRYVLVIVSCAFLILCYFGGYKVKLTTREVSTSELTFMSDEELESSVASDYKSKYRERCTMESCFNFLRCHNGFKVFVYPVVENLPVTVTYQKILNSIYSSKYYTKNATEACLFVLSIDTLDRDILSNDYIRDIESYIEALEHWNGGENHIIFNLYSGTWPDYFEDLGFNTGKAILAKASMAEETYRYDFDVSIPLVHKEHPEVGGDVTPYYSSHLPDTKTYLLAFKGKRYVYGIGSETRNALYHIHNQRDVIAVTTCRHGKSWKDMKDERCDADNAEYDRYDYDVLIQNSSYCLVPRGRRLGSFRFVEVIQFGCIPVILSNGWKLPFFEVIDWTKAAVWGDERLLFQDESSSWEPRMWESPGVIYNTYSAELAKGRKVIGPRSSMECEGKRWKASLNGRKGFAAIYTTLKLTNQVPELVRSIDPMQAFNMRQSSQLLWHLYFSSIDRIVHTTLEIVRERFDRLVPRTSSVWNVAPGALLTLDGRNSQLFEGGNKFTAIIMCHTTESVNSVSRLYKLVQSIGQSKYADTIVILWRESARLPYKRQWPRMKAGVKLEVKIVADWSTDAKFSRSFPIWTNAVFSFHENVSISTDEIDFAFNVWMSFPARIVGFDSRSHYWDDFKNRWYINGKWLNEYSLVFLNAAVYHTYYVDLYWEWLGEDLRREARETIGCDELLFNMLASHVIRKPPIKVTQRRLYEDLSSSYGSENPSLSACFHRLTAFFGYNPLLRSEVRMDPVLYKDPVSNLRKKYKDIEIANP